MEREAGEPQESEDKPNPDVRMRDQSDNAFMAHRPQQRRGRRRPGGPIAEIAENEASAVVHPRRPRSRVPTDITRRGLIADMLREGQEILVQVSKEPLGKKGARITSHIALPGRYLVYMPTVDHVGVSRKIASDEERQRLKRIINEHRAGLPGGFIVRTAAEGRSESEFINDIRFLGNLWTDIRARGRRRSRLLR